jgi:Phosphotransferase enzyme family
LPWRSHLFAALRHPADAKILLLRTDRAWRLPNVVVPKAVWAANARTVVPALERRLGTQPWLLRQLDVRTDEQRQRVEAVFELELVDRGWRPPAHGRFADRRDLERLRLADEHQRELLSGYLGLLERGEVPPERPPWAQPGWIAGVREWVECEVERLGHVVLSLEQVKQWSISAVLRVETDGPDFYFKVALRLPLFVNEAVLMDRLAERFPAYVPRPLAVEPEHGWMLLAEFGELFRRQVSLETRRELLGRFAGLQRRTAALTNELLADGCLDRRLGVLEGQIEPLLDDSEAVHHLEPFEVAELRRLAPVLKEACRQLDGCGLPSTLVHGDLHLGNVTRVEGELQVFDWTDACIGHPFIDLLSLQWESDAASKASLLGAYLEPWREVASAERLQEAVAFAGVVIPLHHAVSYQHIVAGLEPAAKAELDATHEFLREVLSRAHAIERRVQSRP